jgi:hypothetical protein
MKSWKPVVSIVLLLISIIRFAATCAQDAEKDKQRAFSIKIRVIEAKRRLVLKYDSNNADSIGWMLAQAKSYTASLDSSIQYYTENYRADEPRFKKYLAYLYEHKKIYYLYDQWLRYKKKRTGTTKDQQEYQTKEAVFNREVRTRLFELQQKEFDVQYDL